jgi:hypothetical protein
MTQTTVWKVGKRFARWSGVAEPFVALRNEVEQLREQIVRLDAEVVRLDADLDESRRLNLRAAELLDVVYEELGARRPGREGTS